jgi:hypothetical protein
MEIRRVLGLHHSDWIALAEDLKSETLIYLMRQVHHSDKDLFGRLLAELDKRIARIGRRWAQDFDPTTTEEILWKVEKDILDLIVAEKPSRKGDNLEVAFGQVVKRRTINAVEKYNNSPMGRRDEFVPQISDGDGDDPNKIKRPIELAADGRPGPQFTLLESERESLRPRLFKKAYGAVKDPKDREAVKLHIEKGLPIQSADPNQDTVARRLNETVRQAKYRFSKAMKAMRKALGV